MPKARKLPSGNWNCQAYIGKNENGNPKYKSFTASTKKEAEFLASQFTLNKKNYNSKNNLTVGDAIDLYIDSRVGTLSPTTISSYKKIRMNNFKNLMSVNISSVSDVILQQAISYESSLISVRTKKRLVQKVSQMPMV